jgi:two-component system sensor histidine kinase/response regulator
MPEMDGMSCTAEIRSREKNLGQKKLTPIVALTANTLSETPGQCLAVGFSDYYAKPISIGQLQQILQKWLSI